MQIDGVRVDELSLEQRHSLRVSVPGSEEVTVPVEVIVGRTHHPCLGLIAGVHGDEFDGMLALHEIVREVEPAGLRGTLLIIPVANPFAFAAGQRTTPQDGRDLNRVFPGDASGGLSERLAELLCQRLLRQADCVFSLHGAGSSGWLSPWVEFLNLAGPVGRASYDLARASGFTDLIALPRLPGVLLTALGELGVPLIEGEAGGRGAARRQWVDFYKARVRDVAGHAGVWPTTPPVEPAAPSIWHLASIEAEAGGVFCRLVALRQAVRAGDCLGQIIGLYGEVAAEVIAPADGLIGGYRDHAGVREGQSVITLWVAAQDLEVS